MTAINVHPIFVHFPIALLTFYAFFEIVRLPIITRQQWYFPVKAILLIAGMLGGFVALQTGDWASAGYSGESTMNLIHVHSTLAVITMYVYGILAALYLIEWLNRGGIGEKLPNGLQKIWQILRTIEQALFRTWLLILGSFAGLILITMTGALGGAITYGPDIDPVVSFVYHLFFK